MKSVPLAEIKKELAGLSSRKILEICLRLAKYKKENKELLTYLLYETDDEQEYIRKIKEEVDLLFEGINKTNLYYVKKSLRKALRTISKYIKYSGNKQTEVELLIYYCIKFRELDVPYQRSVALSNLYRRQIQKIRKTVKSLHEDLQYDVETELTRLSLDEQPF